MKDTYKTIKNSSEGSFRDKGSKFLAFAFPVEDEDEINEIRAEIKKKYYDARHWVYAFVIGTENQSYRASDDGEPSNSSGPPVLGQIRSFGLTNTLIIVVRYFGGTKLGVPGLINAYKTAAQDALNNAQIIEKKIELPLKLSFEYPFMNDVMRITKVDGVKITNQGFESNCIIELSIRKSLFENIYHQLKKNRNIKIVSEEEM